MDISITQMLLGFGFLWMIVGSLVGFSQGLKHEQHHSELEALASAGDLPGYHRALCAFKHKTTTHTHSMLFPLVAIVIALSMSQLAFTESFSTLLGAILIAAAVIWTLGGLLDVKWLKGLGDALLLGSFAIFLLGLVINV